MFQANRTYEYWIQRGSANKVLEIAPRRAQIERSRLRGSQPQLYCHSRVSEGIVHLELRGQDLWVYSQLRSFADPRICLPSLQTHLHMFGPCHIMSPHYERDRTITWWNQHGPVAEPICPGCCSCHYSNLEPFQWKVDEIGWNLAPFGKDNKHGRLWIKRSCDADFHNPRRWPSQIYTTGVPICCKGATSYQTKKTNTLHGCTRLLLAYESRRRALSFWDRALEVSKWRWIRWGGKRWHTKFEDSSSLFPVEKEPRRKKCSLAARVECDSNTWHGQEDFFVRLVAGFGFMIFMMILCNVFHCHSGHSNPCTCCSNLSLAACRCEALPVGMLQRDQTITTDVTGLTSCTNCTFDPARLKVYKKCHSHQVGTLAIGLHFGFEYLWHPVTTTSINVYLLIP